MEFEWATLHRVSESLHPYQYFRSKFNIRTADIKYAFKRFIEPDLTSYHANRFSFIYELYRARGLKVTDPRDRVFSFLGHFSVRASTQRLATIKANYNKTVAQVYSDVALRTLSISRTIHKETAEAESLVGRPYEDFDLITLSAVQHKILPSTGDLEKRKPYQYRVLEGDSLPTWVPDWRNNMCFVLSEPIHPRRAQGITLPSLFIDEDNLILKIHGVRLDVIERCSTPLKAKELQQKSAPGQAGLPIQRLWHRVCKKEGFNLVESYRNGDSALFAYMQTLSNGCI